MSGTHSPSSHSNESDHRDAPTRTLAIIKNHALDHRLSIEQRILAANLEIVKERQMEFDEGSDQDFLHELFGPDTQSLFEGPVWVYVLERRRAVEVWLALMGNADPEQARIDSPNSLRALYGTSLSQNAVVGSPDGPTAEDQISCLFASSPPFEATELNQDQEPLSWPSDDLSNGQLPTFVRSNTNGTSVNGSGSGSSQGGSLRGRTSGVAHGKIPFKARPVPVTNAVPSIQPRTTRAAALRAGAPSTAPVRFTPARPRTAPSKAEIKQAFLDVPGHKRSETIQVASTAPPVVAPRMTRAASLRQGKPAEVKPVRPRAKTEGDTFDGVPGHKRRVSIAVASVQAPTVAPRLNKSAALRAQKEAAPPSSYMFKAPVQTKTPGSLSRSSSTSSLSPPRVRPVSVQASSSNTLLAGTSSPRRPRPVSVAPGAFAGLGKNTTNNEIAKENLAVAGASAQPPRPPSITPRLNRSAMLRANSGGPTVSPPKKGGPQAKPNGTPKLTRPAFV
ncbi:hypothetical protein BD410DRAFT_788978 [Rickenella mellea]|uniref:Nucleoside diphosphate kinase n=1 Tax=Rickenella mellea TaxID=50990 RepID=A0A4Y7Q4D5_9AGAM|nr:hypothetical protein BD410DRAFT_788978 [Rickenella mellea]